MTPLDQKPPLPNTQIRFEEHGLSVPLNNQKNTQWQPATKIKLAATGALSTLGLCYLAYQRYGTKETLPIINPSASAVGTALNIFVPLGAIGLIYFLSKIARNKTEVVKSKTDNVENKIEASKSKHENVENNFENFNFKAIHESVENYLEASKSKTVNVENNLESSKNEIVNPITLDVILAKFHPINVFQKYINDETQFEHEFSEIIDYLKQNGKESNETVKVNLTLFIKNHLVLKLSSPDTNTPIIAKCVKDAFLELLKIDDFKAFQIACTIVKKIETKKYLACQDIITHALTDPALAVDFAISCADKATKYDWCRQIAENVLDYFDTLDLENESTLATKYVIECSKRDSDLCQKIVIDRFRNSLFKGEIALACVNNLFSQKNVFRKQNKSIVFYVCEKVREKKRNNIKVNKAFLEVVEKTTALFSKFDVATLIEDIVNDNDKNKFNKYDALEILKIKLFDLISEYHINDDNEYDLQLLLEKCLNSENVDLQKCFDLSLEDLNEDTSLYSTLRLKKEHKNQNFENNTSRLLGDS